MLNEYYYNYFREKKKSSLPLSIVIRKLKEYKGQVFVILIKARARLNFKKRHL